MKAEGFKSVCQHTFNHIQLYNEFTFHDPLFGLTSCFFTLFNQTNSFLSTQLSWLNSD